MSKKLEWKLPPTKAESAEKRLEEIIENKSATKYVVIFEGENYWSYFTLDGEARVYPDGFELVYKSDSRAYGVLHIERRRAFIHYDLEKDSEKQLQK